MGQEITLSKFHQDWVEIADKGFADYDSLTRDERVWFNIQGLIGDVGNGGLISHYFNSGADKNGETIEDLNFLGQKEIAGILERINKLFPGGHVSKDIDERNDIISNWPDGQHDDLLKDLDNEFYGREKDLELRLIKHIKEKGLCK